MDAQPTSQRWVWSLVWGQDVVRCFVLVGGPVDGRENMDDTVDRTLSPTWSGASVWGLVGGWCVYVVSGPRVCELAGGGCITWSGVSWIPRVSSLACVRRARWDTRRARSCILMENTYSIPRMHFVRIHARILVSE